MKRYLVIFLLYLLSTENVYSKDYKKGDIVEDRIELDKILSLDLSPGKWIVLDRERWTFNAFSGHYNSLVKLSNNEIVEYFTLGILETSGKRISDVNVFLYEIIYKDKYDGCYNRPEYYLVEVFNKGSTTNCLIIYHTDVKKELYNPDDKKNAWQNAPLRRYVKENLINLPDIMLSSEHIFFARTSSSRYYVIGHSINPKFFNGPKNKFKTEDTSEYHRRNIEKHLSHKKFMENFIQEKTLIHLEMEKRLKLKQYQKLDLAKYSPENKILNNQIKSNKNENKLSYDDIKKLKDLKKLLDDGILTQEEFNIQKKRLLN